MSDTVKATWAGPFPAQLADGREVQPGDSIDIPVEHASSGHWEIAGDMPNQPAPAPVFAPPPPAESGI